MENFFICEDAGMEDKSDGTSYNFLSYIINRKFYMAMDLFRDKYSWVNFVKK